MESSAGVGSDGNMTEGRFTDTDGYAVDIDGAWESGDAAQTK